MGEKIADPRIDRALRLLRMAINRLEHAADLTPESLNTWLIAVEGIRGMINGRAPRRDVASRRIERAIQELDELAKFAAEDANQAQPVRSEWHSWLESQAALVASFEQALKRDGRPDHLAGISAKAWAAAARAWRGATTLPRGKPSPGGYYWNTIVFRLLKPCGFTNAKDAGSMTRHFNAVRRAKGGQKKRERI